MRRRIFVAAAGASLAAPALWAQTYPTKPIQVIVPFAAGGPTDVLARILTQHMSQTLGQTIVVDNTGGAGGTIGAGKAARAAGDGYTLLFSHMGVQAVNIALYKSLPYNSLTDFLPVGLGGTNPMVLVVKKDLPAANFTEFLAYVKANEAKSTYGMAGIGSASHLGGLMLNHMMKTKVLEVPYRGTGPALTDLMAGQFDWMVDQAINVLAQIRAGTIRALGVSSLQRLPQLPDVPTIDEAGLKGYEVAIWNGLFAPKNTPRPAIDRLNTALSAALGDARVRERLGELAVGLPSAAESSPEALGRQLQASIDKWVPVLKSAGVQPQ